MKKQLAGFTLIELVIFIMVTGILAGTIMLSLNTILTGLPSLHNNVLATELADSCMEGFIGERRLQGYSYAGLACSTSPTLPTTCFAPTGFNVSAAITCSPTLSGDTTTSKTVVVTVSGLGNATLTTLLANY